MKLFPPTLIVSDTDGFEKDIFNRRALGAQLSHLVKISEDPLVLALDAQWGSGKTTFLKMWAGDLRKAGHPVIYFDAFENDYAEDAFIALASEIIELTQEKKSKLGSKSKKIVEASVAVAKVLSREALKTSVKLGTFGVLDGLTSADTAKELSTALSGVSDKILGEQLTKQNEVKKNIKTFKSALSELPKLLQQDGSEKTLPLIFLIDELDRCKPLFSLQVLERIKHLFSVPNVHFVFGVHLDQLYNSVRAAYGQGIDAEKYLQKFVNLKISFIDTESSIDRRVTSKYINYLTNAMFSASSQPASIMRTVNDIAVLSNHLDFSLREIDHVFSVLACALAFTPEGYPRPSPILSGLCVMKIRFPELYRKAKQQNLEYQEFRDSLKIKDLKADSQPRRDGFINWWRFCIDPSFLDADKPPYYRSLIEFNYSSGAAVVADIANEQIDRFMPR